MRKLSAVYWVAFVEAWWVSAAHAQEDIGSIADRGAGLLDQIANFMVLLFAVGGIGAAGWGVWALTVGRKNRQNDSALVPALAVIGGGLIAALTYVMGVVSVSTFGSNETTLTDLGL